MSRKTDRPRKGGSFIRGADGKLQPAPQETEPKTTPAPGGKPAPAADKKES